MLYSEGKERENRFKLALKIGFPFLLLICAFILFSKRLNNLSDGDLVLLIILSVIYIYYIFYLIYSGFKSSLIDPVTKTFNRSAIMKYLEQEMKHHTNGLAVMICVSNIADINERYGIRYGDIILRKFTKQLHEFLEDYNFKNIPIGRYGGGYFLALIRHKETELRHILGIFERNLKSVGVEEIEIKIDISMVPMSYDENKENITLQLLELLDNNQEESPSIKPDAYDKMVCSAIDRQNFVFKYQPVLDTESKTITRLEILIKLYSKEYGTLSRSQISSIVNRNGYEVRFDEKIMERLMSEIKPLCHFPILFSLQVSVVSLRNQKFREFLQHLIEAQKIDPKRFILEISEKRPYEEIQRFHEILIQYKMMGFKIALDHFGGNNASVEYLKHLPISSVNFDIEYTKNLNEVRYNLMLHSYIKLLKELGIKSMVKFIDKKEAFEKVQKMGVDYIQGYAVGKPQTLKIIQEQLEKK